MDRARSRISVCVVVGWKTTQMKSQTVNDAISLWILESWPSDNWTLLNEKTSNLKNNESWINWSLHPTGLDWTAVCVEMSWLPTVGTWPAILVLILNRTSKWWSFYHVGVVLIGIQKNNWKNGRQPHLHSYWNAMIWLLMGMMFG